MRGDDVDLSDASSHFSDSEDVEEDEDNGYDSDHPINRSITLS